MKQLEGRTIVLGVTGGIAAYKAAYLLQCLGESGGAGPCDHDPQRDGICGPLTFETLSDKSVLPIPLTEIFSGM